MDAEKLEEGTKKEEDTFIWFLGFCVMHRLSFGCTKPPPVRMEFHHVGIGQQQLFYNHI